MQIWKNGLAIWQMVNHSLISTPGFSVLYWHPQYRGEFYLWIQQQGHLSAGSWWAFLRTTGTSAGVWDITLLNSSLQNVCHAPHTHSFASSHAPLQHNYWHKSVQHCHEKTLQSGCSMPAAEQVQPPFSHSWEGMGQRGKCPGRKNKAEKHQKVEKYVLGYFPYTEWFESMSQNPQSELPVHFFNLICPAAVSKRH